MIFILVYCTAGISGGHNNPAVTFGLFLARKVSLITTVAYMVAQCLGAICGVGLVKAFIKNEYNSLDGGANAVAFGYNEGTVDVGLMPMRLLLFFFHQILRSLGTINGCCHQPSLWSRRSFNSRNGVRQCLLKLI
ncbi:hypothetical protein REPUB_Repub17cG0026600 [Reevesia pubescens]